MVRLGRAPLWAATVLGVGWRMAQSTVRLVGGRARSAGFERDPAPRDERAMRWAAEAELGGPSSEQNQIAFETRANPGDTPADSVGSGERAIATAKGAGEITIEDEEVTPEEAAIDEEEHALAHERRHRRGLSETRRGA
jgi:hypothetical protein